MDGCKEEPHQTSLNRSHNALAMSAATDNNSMDVTYSKATSWFSRMWDEMSFALDQFYYSEVSKSHTYINIHT